MFQTVESGKDLCLKSLLELGTKILVETENFTTPSEALCNAINQMASEYQNSSITARQAVITLLEATHLLPGVYNTQMLSWRHTIQRLLHQSDFSPGFMSLNYNLKLTESLPKSCDTATQTKISNPNSDHKLEFTHSTFDLKWVLSDYPWN